MKSEPQTREMIEKNLILFFNEQTKVHIVIKDSQKFYNGQIKKITPAYFIIADKKGDFPISKADIYKLEPYENN